MGIVPNLVTGVWVGGDDRATHFKTTRYGQGAAMALPIWGLYMKDVYNNKDLGVSDGGFIKPKNLSIEVDCEKYKSQNTDNGDFDELDF
jgi:penicillin-binding protein 1A